MTFAKLSEVDIATKTTKSLFGQICMLCIGFFRGQILSRSGQTGFGDVPMSRKRTNGIFKKRTNDVLFSGHRDMDIEIRDMGIETWTCETGLCILPQIDF